MYCQQQLINMDHSLLLHLVNGPHLLHPVNITYTWKWILLLEILLCKFDSKLITTGLYVIVINYRFDDHMPKPKTSWQRPPGVPKLNLQLIDELLSTTSDQCGPFTPPTPSEWSPSSSASQINDCELFTPPTPSEWSSPDSD